MPADAETAISREPICPEGFSIFSSERTFEFYRNLHDQYRSPVWDEAANGWILFDYEEVAKGQRDESLFANAYINADDTLRRIKGGGANITLSQGEEHTRLRRFHLKLLSPSNVEQYRVAHMLPIIEQTLDALGNARRIEAASAIADRIPPRVISSLLGMDHRDDAAMDRLLELNHEIVALISTGYRSEEGRERALAASAELNEILLPHIRKARETPSNDFISRVWQEAPAAGLELDEEAALGLCRELFFAGSDTTVYGIANVLFTMLSQPEVRTAVRTDRDKALKAVIEEGMRLRSVVMFRHRICVQDVTIGDAHIRKGDIVFIGNAAANRDPDHYHCPADVDLERRPPTDHFAFGRGNRSCIGSHFARTEMREVLDMMLDGYPDMRLDPDAEPPVFTGTFMRRMCPLHLILRD